MYKKQLTKYNFSDIIFAYFLYLLNATKELRLFGTAVQRVDGRCKSICYKNSVSFRSRAPQPLTACKELRTPRYHGYRLFRALMSDCFCSNRGGTADFEIRP